MGGVKSPHNFNHMIRHQLKVKIEPFQCPMFRVLISECNLHCDFCTIPFEKRTLLKNSKPPSTRVVNLQDEDYDILIDRTTKWGNKFKIKTYGREKSILLYKEWILNNQDMMNSLPELKGKRLGCHCKPNGCHGDILVELVNEYCK